MRFFLDFVSCYGSATVRSAEDDERSLVSSASGPLRRRKMRGRVAAPEWRPSLGSISEDNEVAQRERGDPRSGTVKRRSSTGATAAAKVYQRNYSDDYGRAAMPAIMPAFSPTPFMF